MITATHGILHSTTVAWTPASLTGLKAWYKSDVGITLNSGNVSQWDDQSGNGNHLIQATATNQPLYSTGILNGYQGLQFFGLNHALKSSFTLVQPETVFVLFLMDGNTRPYNTLFDGYTVISGACDINYSAGNRNISPYAGAGGIVTSNFNALAWSIVAVNFNSTSSNVYLNSDAVVTGNLGTNDMGGFTLGNSGGGLYFMGGWIVESFVMDNSISSGDWTLVKSYINAKYALSFT